MIILLALLAASLAGELLLTYRPFWRFRRLLAPLCLLALSFAATGLLVTDPGVWSGLLALASLYRLVNLARVIEDRMHEMFARHTVRQTAAWLGLAQAAVLGFMVMVQELTIDVRTAVYIVAAVQLTAALLLAWSLARQLRTTRPQHDKLPASDSKLPSLTVAIPARNEDAQLEACISSVLASDYPKLEIIVLDDCSADRTPDIIRGFAQAGVRFIRGSQPADGWLAKNQAYDRLQQEASGNLILFCGVDVRFQPGCIRQLVATMQSRRKTMLSLLPLNPRVRRMPLVQAMRYYWEMVPPRRLFNRPPVLSSCWLVTKDSLRKAGGFGAVRRSITPEAHFAKAAIVSDGYSFIRSDHHLGITSEKPPQEQFDTAVQTRYPQIHRRPELVLAVASVEFLLFLAPLVVVPYGLITLDVVLVALPLATLLLQTYAFGRLQRTVFPRVRGQAYSMFLPAIIADLALLHYSMYKYEFSEVYWKGRNVCYPVMRVIPRLPKLR